MNRIQGSNASKTSISCRFLVLILLTLTSGCWNSATNQQQVAAKLKDKKPERPFEEMRVFTEPNERSSYDAESQEEQRITLLGKPAHWSGILVQGRANLADFNGTLVTTPHDSQQRPADLERNPFWVTTARAASFPKGQRKVLETLFFPPRPQPNATVLGSTWIAMSLQSRGGGTQLEHVPEILQHMPSFQYFMLVLSPQSARYRWLIDLPTVQPPTVHAPASMLDTFNYRVLFPPVDKPLALPSQMIGWTSTAYVLWDGTLPTALTPDHQQALIDWIHWGGGLVISGPDSLDTLKGSFLEPYLPAVGGASGPLDASKLAELHTAWTIDGDKSAALGTRAGNAWSGVELVKHPAAEYLPNTAGLAIERRVGRGRIVVTAFRLTEIDLVNWPSFDSFFNACLLGRPPREFETREPRFHFVSGAGDDGDDENNDGLDEYDPDLSTGLRILTRDERDPESTRYRQISSDDAELWTIYAATDPIQMLKTEPGTAGWNDFSWLSNAARDSLQSAAGISVPKREFVVKMVGIYLVVVVLLNWALFRLIGRLEWAWVAVPLVAIIWGVLVVWLAQLDIGFARAQTEIDVLEVQPGYSRGHLTRYTALYTSLSSDYDLALDDPTAVALPFSSNRERLTGQASSEVTLTTMGERELRGFAVASNSTGMVHGEQMFGLGGQIRGTVSGDGQLIVENTTEIRLTGVAVIRRHEDGSRLIDETAWLGAIDAGATARGTFSTHDADGHAERRSRDKVTMPAEEANGQLNLRTILDRVEDHRVLAPGEIRLVGWHDGILGAQRVSPPAAQHRGATVVVAHLEFARASSPIRDLNLRPIRRNPFELPSTLTP
jgi:hypothetical protein